MAKHGINDFSVGDTVIHLSNRDIRMVVIKKDEENNILLCKWIDKNGNTKTEEFIPEELGKPGTGGMKISVIGK